MLHWIHIQFVHTISIDKTRIDKVQSGMKEADACQENLKKTSTCRRKRDNRDEDEFHMNQQKLPSIQNSDRGMKIVEDEASPDALNHMCGKVSHNKVKTPNVKFIEISNFAHVDDSALVHSISLVSNDEAWINRYNIKRIDKVDHTGNIIHKRKLPTYLTHFIILDSGDIVYSNFGLKTLRRASPSGTVTNVCSTTPLHPKGICRSREGGVLVCLVDCDIPEITPGSRGEVHAIDTSGGILKKYSHSEDKNQLFIHPNRIAQNINMDLCVVDRVDKDFTSRLVVLSSRSMMRFTYFGQSVLKRRFVSHDVSCDHRGRIMVTDIDNHAVHLLREDGYFLQYILTKHSPLWRPTSLALHCDLLWMGCNKGVVRVYKYIDEEC